MKSPLDSLNLRPSEKRLVVAVSIVLFIVLNFWFVIPHFSDWGKVTWRKKEAERKLAMYMKEINDAPGIQRKIRELEGAGLSVPAEEQALRFTDLILREQARSGVNLMRTGRQQTRTNQFFLEISSTIGVESGEEQLVNFLFNLGASNSLIRVRDLSVRPDQQRQKLASEIKLVASYQKNAPKAATPAPRSEPKAGAARKTASAPGGGK